MITKKTVVDQIEVTRASVIQVRFGKLLLEGDKVIACQWHRTAFWPGLDIDEHMVRVNTHLESMGEAPVDAVEIDRLKKLAQVAWSQ